jgi:hypothetical protein
LFFTKTLIGQRCGRSAQVAQEDEQQLFVLLGNLLRASTTLHLLQVLREGVAARHQLLLAGTPTPGTTSRRGAGACW